MKKALKVLTLGFLLATTVGVSADAGVSISGVKNNGYYNDSNLTVTASDVDKFYVGKSGVLVPVKGSSYTIKNKYSEKGTLISDTDGYWQAKAVGKDGKVKIVKFEIDKHAPTVPSLVDYSHETKSTKTTSITKTVKVNSKGSYLMTFRDKNLSSVTIKEKRFKARYGSYTVKVGDDSFSWHIHGYTGKTITCQGKDKAGNVTKVLVKFKKASKPKPKPPKHPSHPIRPPKPPKHPIHTPKPPKPPKHPIHTPKPPKHPTHTPKRGVYR